MNKLFSLLAVVAILFPLSANSAVVGDVNQDGKIDLMESIYALQVAAGVYPTLPDSCLLTGQGSWENGIVYNLCDVISFDGDTYACSALHTSATGVIEPTNTAYWTQLSIKGEKGDIGPSGPPVPSGYTIIGNSLTPPNGYEYQGVLNGESWIYKNPMSTIRSNFPASVVDGKIYVMGGHGISSYLDTVEMYDPSNNTWTLRANMGQGKSYFESVSLAGMIYAMGGVGNNGSSFFKSVEMYNPNDNSWTPKTSMSTVRYAFGSAVVNGKIYVMGGESDFAFGTPNATVEMYDPSTDGWTTKASMGTERESFASAVIDGKIYVMGGYNGTYLDTVEMYDPSTNTWTPKASLSHERIDPEAVAVDGKIYIMGGYPLGGQNLNTVEMYDPSTNTWTPQLGMNQARSVFGSAVIDEVIYVMGGVKENSGGAENKLDSIESKQGLFLFRKI